jgi:hypothetical protein
LAGTCPPIVHHTNVGTSPELAAGAIDPEFFSGVFAVLLLSEPEQPAKPKIASAATPIKSGAFIHALSLVLISVFPPLS